jgi:hypothetical protein
MRDQNRHRLALIAGRYAARVQEKRERGAQSFDEAFCAAREAVIQPALEEIAAALVAAGHKARVTLDGAEERPSIELRLEREGDAEIDGANLVGFSVIRRRKEPEVLAYLVVRPPPMDLLRFASPSELSVDQVEQITVDAIEHIFACWSI